MAEPRVERRLAAIMAADWSAIPASSSGTRPAATNTPYRGFRFPKTIIQHAIWLYLRFTLSLRDVEELLAERGISVTYETVRVWVVRFGPQIARRLRRRRGPSSGIWHLDEMFVKIGGQQMYLWRAVDSEGEVLDMLVQSRRDKAAAMRLMRKLSRTRAWRRWRS